MKTSTFNTVNELAERKSENKTAQYLEMARNFAKQANEIEATTGSFIARMSAKEVVLSMRKVESCDCEYTAYVNANHAEKWLEKAINANDMILA